MTLFDDPRVIEAACAAAWGEHHWPRVPNAAGEREYMSKALTAAVAALPREELVEKLAAHMALCDAFQQSRWHYLHHTAKALVAIGLIPEHVTPEHEKGAEG